MMKMDEADNQSKKCFLKENFGKSILPLSLLDNEIRPGGNPIEILLFYKKETSLSEIQKSFTIFFPVD